MADTYTQLYIHIVFAVYGRESLIHDHFRNELYRYITGIIQTRNNKLIAINGMPNHVHILVGLHPAHAISDLVRHVKTSSTNHVNANAWVRGKFHWQNGFAAFSYSRREIGAVVEYIERQQEHHAVRTFREELLDLFSLFGVEHDPMRIMVGANEVR